MNMQVVAGSHVKHADHDQPQGTNGIAGTDRDSHEPNENAAIALEISEEIPGVEAKSRQAVQVIKNVDGSSHEGERKFSAPYHAEDGQVQTDFNKLIEDARADLIKAASAARLLGVASALSPKFAGTPRTLGEIKAFSTALASSLVAVGFMRPEVREAYVDVVNAAIVLNNRVWQAQRALVVAVEVAG